jgi:hypothetical protein
MHARARTASQKLRVYGPGVSAQLPNVENRGPLQWIPLHLQIPVRHEQREEVHLSWVSRHGGFVLTHREIRSRQALALVYMKGRSLCR